MTSNTIIDIIHNLKKDFDESLFEYENKWDVIWELIQIVLKMFGYEMYCVEPFIKQIYYYTPNENGISQNTKEKDKENLHYLKQLILPEQRTPEWFKFRQTKLTASELSYCINGKVTGAIQKKIILQKLYPDKVPYISSAATSHGTLFEEVAQFVYERMFGVVLHEFGCVPHKTVPWLAASPDGISDEAIMVEIKCPYSRTPKGIPSFMYYTQIQAQLEVCDLEKCDFMECLIHLYESRKDYILHTVEKGCKKIKKILNNSYYQNIRREYLPKEGILKGVSLIIETTNGPVHKCITMKEMKTISSKDWIQQTLQTEKKRNKMTGYDLKYWILKEIWITRIMRNRDWFHTMIVPKAYEFWKYLEQQKVETTIDVPEDKKPLFVEETI